jgi:hypothetical protein
LLAFSALTFLSNPLLLRHLSLQLQTNQKLMQSKLIKINRGIFQGDSLSPLLFCIALITLIHELNRSGCR